MVPGLGFSPFVSQSRLQVPVHALIFLTVKKELKILTCLSCHNSKPHHQQIFAYNNIICWTSDIYKYIEHTYIVCPILMEKQGGE
jgi:hypothetical protein